MPVVMTILAIVVTIFEVLKAIIKSIVYLITFDWGKLGDIWKEAGSNIGNAWQRVGNTFNGKAYASGGFPEDGFFFANHNELVGQFSNGKTAVANNEQITQGIHDAVLQAMRESSDGEREIIINMDGYQVAKVVNKRQNNLSLTTVGTNIKWGT